MGAFIYASIPVIQYSAPLEKIQVITFNKPMSGSSPYQFLDLSITDSQLSLIPRTITTSQQTLVFTVDFIIYLIALLGWVNYLAL